MQNKAKKGADRVKKRLKAKAWSIPTVSLSQAFFAPTADSLPSAIPVKNLRYTIIDRNNVYYSAKELAELARATGSKSPASLVAYRPDRIALHQALIFTISHIQLSADGSDLASKMKVVYEHMQADLKALIPAFDQERNDLMTKAASGDTTCIEAELEAIEGKLNPDAKMGAFISDYTLKRAAITLAVDAYMQRKINAAMQTLAEQIGHVLCAGSGHPDMVAVAIPAPAERTTLMVAGGIASGKGRSVFKLLVDVRDTKGIEPKNIVMVNGDALKPILLKPGSVDPGLYSQLCTDEATHVKALLFNRLGKMAEAGVAPHALIDQTGLKREQLAYALTGGGSIEATFVSTDVRTAVERSYLRGIADGERGRYENTGLILLNHKAKAAALPNALVSLVGENARVVVVDNNVVKGEDPTPIMEFDARANKITVLNEDKFMAFISKVAINTKATRPAEVMDPDQPVPLIAEYLQPIIDAATSKGLLVTVLLPALPESRASAGGSANGS